MKRRLFKLALFLLLGAIVNVAVAWGCAIRLDIRKSSGTSLYRSLYPDESQSEDPFWMVSRLTRPGAMHLFSHRGMPHHGPSPSALEGLPESLVPNWARDELLPWQSSSITQLNDFGNWTVDARGWPQLSLWCVWARKILRLRPAEGGIQLPERWVMEHDRQWLRVTTLPYRPIWPGFAINTIFYATILWLLTLGPFTARRMIRRKRGLCIKCGYDLRGMDHDKCPECGH
ncbi:MAG: hypothetical protein IH984_17135 [Planctomycetes bacterium]|nr:hypothetical protein [Planctomycetota bacterium]